MEVDHAPGNDRDEVDANDEANVVQAEADTPHTPADLVVSGDGAATISTTGCQLQGQGWDGKEGEGHEVGEKPLDAIVVEDSGRVA